MRISDWSSDVCSSDLSYVQAMGKYDKWTGLKNAAFIKLLELQGNDTVYYAASAERFTNPRANQLTDKGSISASHPILDALEKQSDYYTASGDAQQRSSLP